MKNMKNGLENSIVTKLNLMDERFPIICISGATFDLSGYEELIRNLPSGSGAAIVVINNMKQAVPLLSEVLTRSTSMPVEAITEKARVRPNRIYVLYPGHDLRVLDGEFRLAPVSKPTGWWNTATIFLNSLARDWPGQLFSVVLSGHGGDGAAALHTLKKAEGITIAQDVQGRGAISMLVTAISTGHIDLILPVQEIAEMLCGSRRCQSKERSCPRCVTNPPRGQAAADRYNAQAA